MTNKTYLSNTITAVGDGLPSFNANALKLLADKQVLSRILKYTVSEYKDMDFMDIMACIDEIQVQSIPVDPGLSNLGPIKGDETVDTVQNEGTIIYDVRFTSRNMDSSIKILLNVEAQNIQEESRLKYHLVNRIIFYLARMISSQKNTEFFHSDYDNIKKVISIWICICDTPRGGIETISLRPEVLYGEKSGLMENDLMTGILIRVPREKRDESLDNELIDVLYDLFKKESADEKKRKLINKHGFIMTTEVEREVYNMCNLAEMYIDMGMEQGKNNLKNAILLIRSGVDTEEELIKNGISPEDAKIAIETMFSKV